MKYDKRDFEIELGRLIQKAITDMGLPQSDVIAGLEAMIRQENGIKEYADACARTY